jgi:hypothetical protein
MKAWGLVGSVVISLILGGELCGDRFHAAIA